MSETYEPLNVIYLLNLRHTTKPLRNYSLPFVIKSDAQEFGNLMVQKDSDVKFHVTTENLRGDMDVFVRRNV